MENVGQGNEKNNERFAVRLALIVAIGFFLFWTIVIGILEPIAQEKRKQVQTQEEPAGFIK
jgi:hypothetical protein